MLFAAESLKDAMLKDITRGSVLKAIEECNKLGHEEFLRKYGFEHARKYFLVYDGQYYDSKAIAGVAHRYEFPEEGILRSRDFSGGNDTVRRLLQTELGFIVLVCDEERISDIALPAEPCSIPFDPSDITDTRKQSLLMVVQRQGQRNFRNELLDAYGEACAVTGCKIIDVLEAAHIYRYQGQESNHVTNGLLLRADIHTLFDRGLIAINAENLKISLAQCLKESEYRNLHGERLRLPENENQRPSAQALNNHWETSIARQDSVS